VHAEGEELMKSLAGTDPVSPAFDEQVTALLAAMRSHFADEDDALLPRLRASCDPGELRELGLRFEQARRIAPTRPHPAAPDTPPANKIVDLGVGLIDRVRDAMSGRNK
jgi:hypothetical protein